MYFLCCPGCTPGCTSGDPAPSDAALRAPSGCRARWRHRPTIPVLRPHREPRPTLRGPPICAQRPAMSGARARRNFETRHLSQINFLRPSQRRPDVSQFAAAEQQIRFPPGSSTGTAGHRAYSTARRGFRRGFRCVLPEYPHAPAGRVRADGMHAGKRAISTRARRVAKPANTGHTPCSPDPWRRIRPSGRDDTICRQTEFHYTEMP